MFIKAARIGAPFGLQGGVHLYPHSGQRDHLLPLDCLYYYKKDSHPSYQPLTIEEIKPHGTHLRAFFHDIEDRTAAEGWTGIELFINTTELLPLPESQYYWYQLEGLEVLSSCGSDMGSVQRVYSNGPQDIIVTTDGEHIPFVIGHSIASVDLSSKKIHVLFESTSFDGTPEN